MKHRTLDRSRIGAFLTALVTVLGLFVTTLFLAFVMHDHLGFTPVMTSAAFLPLVAGTVFAAAIVPARLLAIAGAKPLLTAGLLVCASAQFWLSFLPVDVTYAVHLLGPLLLMGLGLGTAVSTAIATASPAGHGAGRVGVSTLAGVLSIAAATTRASFDHAPVYALAFAVAAAVFLATAMIESFLLPDDPRDDPFHLSN